MADSAGPFSRVMLLLAGLLIGSLFPLKIIFEGGLRLSPETTPKPSYLRISPFLTRHIFNNFTAAAKAPPDVPSPLLGSIIVPEQRLPLFLVIGAQKAGTTFYRHLLNLHPALQSSRGMEGNPGGETHFIQYKAKLNATQANAFGCVALRSDRLSEGSVFRKS